MSKSKKPTKEDMARYEYPDPTPAFVNLSATAPPTLQQQVKAMIQMELSDQMAAEGFETWDEADDFDVDDDEDREEYISRYVVDDEAMPLDEFASEANPNKKKKHVVLDDEDTPDLTNPEKPGAGNDGDQHANQ